MLEVGMHILILCVLRFWCSRSNECPCLSAWFAGIDLWIDVDPRPTEAPLPPPMSKSFSHNHYTTRECFYQPTKYQRSNKQTQRISNNPTYQTFTKAAGKSSHSLPTMAREIRLKTQDLNCKSREPLSRNLIRCLHF